jgi:hypothetical protein
MKIRLVSGSMGYRKREMLKKFQHDRDMVTVLSIGYGLWRLGASEKEGHPILFLSRGKTKNFE